MKILCSLTAIMQLLFATCLQADPFPPEAYQQPAVVDANGRFVGWPHAIATTYYSYCDIVAPLVINGVERYVDGNWIEIPITSSGFDRFINGVNCMGQYHFLYTTPDCTGTPYISANEVPHIGIINVNGSEITLSFSVAPFAVMNFQSWSGSTLANSGCGTYFDFEGPVFAGPAKTVNVNSWGLVPPFTVKSLPARQNRDYN